MVLDGHSGSRCVDHLTERRFTRRFRRWHILVQQVMEEIILHFSMLVELSEQDYLQSADAP